MALVLDLGQRSASCQLAPATGIASCSPAHALFPASMPLLASKLASEQATSQQASHAALPASIMLPSHSGRGHRPC